MITSAADFVRLRSSDDPTQYLRAAREPAPVEVWREVLSQYPDFAFWVAQNKTVPFEILRDLADNAEPRVRSMVARKRKLPAELQRVLAQDPDAGVRAALAHNTKVIDEVLVILSEDREDFVAAIAREKLRRAGPRGN